MNIFYWILPLLILTYVVLDWVLRIPLRIKYRKYPGEPFKLFSGHQQEVKKDVLGYDAMLCNKYPRWCVRFLGSEAQLVVTSPDLFRKAALLDHRQLLYKSQEDAARLEGPKSLYGKDLFLSNGMLWKDLRNLFNPAFTSATLLTYQQVMLQCIEHHIKILSANEKSGEVININSFAKSITLQIIMKAAYGIDMDIDIEKDRKDLEELSFLSDNILNTSQNNPVTISLTLFPFLARPLILFFRMFGLLDTYNQIRASVGVKVLEVANRKKAESKEIQKNTHQPTTKNLHDDDEPFFKSENTKGSSLQNFPDWKNYQRPGLIIDLANKGLHDNKPLTYDLIVAQLKIFLIAGHDTTATTLSFAIYELSKNRNYEKLLLEEIDSFGRNKQVSVEDLQQFPVTKAVINETMRLHPPVPLIARGITEQKFVLDGQEIPKNTSIILPIRGMQRSELNWPKAQEFHPTRWLGQKEYQSKTITPAFFPFGYGPRICIGMRLATNELLFALIRIYQQYTFSVPEISQTMPEAYRITMVPTKKMLLNINKRT